MDTDVREIQEQIKNEVENEENQEQGGNTAKAMALGAAALATMVGAGYGLYRLGKVAVGKIKEYKQEREITEPDEEDFIDDEEPEEQKK